jgi:hypothetical protein
MANQAWLDEVRERLANEALPPAYIRRFTEELADHLQDITEENMRTANTVSRLGEPQQVAEAAVIAYRRRSFLGRHPLATFLVFAVSPILSQFVQVIFGLIVFGVVGLIAERFGFFGDHGKFVPPGPAALAVTSYTYDLVFVILPTILAAVLYCKLAKRLALGKKWMFVSCFMLAAMAMLPCGYVRLGMDATGHPLLSGGFGVPSLHNWFAWNSQMSEIIQLSIPLAIGWWLIRRLRQEKLQLAS